MPRIRFGQISVEAPQFSNLPPDPAAAIFVALLFLAFFSCILICRRVNSRALPESAETSSVWQAKLVNDVNYGMPPDSGGVREFPVRSTATILKNHETWASSDIPRWHPGVCRKIGGFPKKFGHTKSMAKVPKNVHQKRGRAGLSL